MKTNLTPRMDASLVRRAKAETRRRGKSVSKMTAEFIETLAKGRMDKTKLPPITRSLVGILKGCKLSEADYRRHLREKYL